MPWMTLEYEVTMRFIADIEYAKVIHRITFCYRLQISNRLQPEVRGLYHTRCWLYMYLWVGIVYEYEYKGVGNEYSYGAHTIV